MSFHDVTMICSNLPAGNHCACTSDTLSFICTSAGVHARTANTINASKPLHLFLNPIFMLVTYVHMHVHMFGGKNPYVCVCRQTWIMLYTYMYPSTLNSTYNEVAFNEKSPIMKENIHIKYTSFTYKYIALNEKLTIMKQNLHIFFLL